FVASALALALGYLACRYIVTSRMGRVLVAIRDAETRTRSSGYQVESYKLWLFVFSAVLAPIAGELYVPQVDIINPGDFSTINSIEMVVWVAAGGRGTLYGAVVGAFAVNYAKTFFTTFSPETWLFILGALFVLVTLLLPQGIVGLLGRLQRKGDTPWMPSISYARPSAGTRCSISCCPGRSSTCRWMSAMAPSSTSRASASASTASRR